MTKNSGFIILGVIFLSLSLHPRVNHLLTHKLQPKTAYSGDLTAVQLWEIREFDSIGAFSQVSEWPDYIITAFPPPSPLPFSRALTYTSDTIQSIDYLATKEHLEDLNAMITSPLPPNRTISFTRSNHTWVIGVFDATTALKVNGYFSDIIEGDYWVHIGTKTN